MGRGRKGSGVQLREHDIRIRFTWQGERYEEPLKLKPTVAGNVKHAHRLAAEVKRAIDAGSFDLAHYFPDSKRVQATGDGSLKALCELWLKSQGRLAAATKSQYRNALAFWQRKLGADRNVRDFGHIFLAAEIGGHPWKSGKLCNNYLIPLRGVFELAKKGKLIPDNPLDGIENMPVQENLPDPLEVAEVDQILEHMRATYDERVWNYFHFAFFTGMRPEELIALKWAKIDFNRRAARVEVAKTFKGTEQDVKTKVARDVDLDDDAMAALARQKKHTFLKDHGYVFENPITNRPWHDERSQRDTFWKPTLKKLGIRERAAYQTRSTCATLMLMADMNPAYCAGQLGHSVQMFFKKYAKWINRADHGRQRNKRQAFLEQQRKANSG